MWTLSSRRTRTVAPRETSTTHVGPTRRAAHRYGAWPEDRRIHHLASRTGEWCTATSPSSSVAVSGRAEGFAAALAGNINAEMVDGATQRHEFATRAWPERLIETYAPIHADALGKVLGAAEFYQATGARRSEAGRAAAQLARRRRDHARDVPPALQPRAARQPDDHAQQRELRDRVDELSGLLAENAQLDATVRARRRPNDGAQRAVPAAGRGGFARRPGPGPRIRADAARIDDRRASPAPARAATPRSRRRICRGARGHRRGDADLRSISGGIQLPEIEPLVVWRGGRARGPRLRAQDGRNVWTLPRRAGAAPLPVKITLYRVLQELLANGFRHAGGATSA